MTRSVNQNGQIQAVGGINEKIEGFFDVCQARSLTGREGVLIPTANIRHLMLRRDVVESVTRGTFHIFAVDDVDQGIEILTGLPAGVRDASGAFPDGTPGSVMPNRENRTGGLANDVLCRRTEKQQVRRSASVNADDDEIG